MSTRSSVSRLAGAGLTAACAAGLFLSGCVPPALAQENPLGPPRSVTFWGVATNPNGQPKTGVAGVTFSLYKDEQGGAPLWMETQNVTLDSAGGYTAQIGATHPEGLPIDLFASGQARWLEVQVDGQPAGQRALLVSVPYALKAVDAQTLGGLPASAYALAGTGGNGAAHAETGAPIASTPVAAVSGPAKPAADPDTTVGGGGTTNFIPIWTSSTALGSSVIVQKSGNVGIGASSSAKFTVSGAADVAILGATTAEGGSALQGQAKATSGAGIGVFGVTDGSSGYGVLGQASATSGTNYGVSGTTPSDAGIGVRGEASATSGSTYGVFGTTASSAGTGVQGNNTATGGDTSGVVGTVASPTGRAVEGDSNATTGNTYGVIGFVASDTGIGVQGQATATSGENYGVSGSSASDTGTGVQGQVTATSGKNYGVFGSSASSQGAGVFGVGIEESDLGAELAGNPAGVWGDTQTGTAGVLATADDAQAIAAYNNAGSVATLFLENQTTHPMASVLATLGSGGSCNIFVNGNLACTGSVGGHAAVPAVTGGTRDVALYAVQAPENWFEDAGSGQLHNGAAVVTLDAEYAATVNTGMDYHVFLTPKGDCKGLYVANETGGSFEVHELGGGNSSIAFDYRIMARRKGFEDIRMADLTGKVQKEMSPIPVNGVRLKHAKASRASVRAARRAPAAVMARPAVVVSPAPVAVK